MAEILLIPIVRMEKHSKTLECAVLVLSVIFTLLNLRTNDELKIWFFGDVFSLFRRSRMNDSFLPRIDRGLRAIQQMEFAQNIADMSLDRVLADDQFLRDQAVG